MKKLKIFIVGLILGAVSWIVCPLVSNQVEPFDTDAGCILGQWIMSIGTAYIGYKKGFLEVIICTIGIYVGQNAYAYYFVSDDWFTLGLITISFLCIVPLQAGIVFSVMGKLIRKIVVINKRKKSNKIIEEGHSE